jgi:ribosomal protein S18 acetylase RimI-like enzyme
MSNAVIAAARPEELAAAFQLLFRCHPPEQARGRVSSALAAVERGDFDPAGVLVAHGAAGLCGVLALLPLRGATALVWPPQADDDALEDALTAHALELLRGRGTKIAQALLTTEEVPSAAPLLRHGFRHVTVLEFLRHPLDQQSEPHAFPDGDEAPERLTYHAYDAATAERFHETLLRTYVDGLDCPELNHARGIADIIDGHQAHGRYDPQRWWLALENGRPAGVLLLNELPEWRSLDVSYLGVVPEARGRGFGRELTQRALTTARRLELPQVTLTVDRRNVPARNLYNRLGFEWFDERAVFLAFLARPANRL